MSVCICLSCGEQFKSETVHECILAGLELHREIFKAGAMWSRKYGPSIQEVIQEALRRYPNET